LPRPRRSPDPAKAPTLARAIEEYSPTFIVDEADSFFTGKNPGKHGVFDFVTQDRKSYEFHPVDSRSNECVMSRKGPVLSFGLDLTDSK
jgi:hypothetical protein